MIDFLQLPESRRYRIVNAGVPTSTSPANPEVDATEIFVEAGLISEPHDGPVVDLRSSMLLPAFTDMHTHLDKGHIWPRSPNPDGTFESALATVQADRTRNWRAEDVRRRMEFSLKCAHSHGTRAIRTHLDSASPQHLISWPVFDEVRSDWSGRIELQAVTILGIEEVDDSGKFTDIANTAAKFGGVLGCVTYPVADLDRRLDIFFSMAAERGMDADLHVDESSDRNVATLGSIAKAIMRVGFEGKTVAGHCCSIALQPDSQVSETLDLVAKAGISVVSLPMCNLYLQNRLNDHTPRWRGVTLIHEMRSRGIKVCFASDNTRDPFYAYGDLDMIEVLRESTRICHLDHCADSWFNSFTTIPSEICGFTGNNLLPGDSADFVICSARNWSELLSRPQMDRVVVRNGRTVNRKLPSYSELDDLMEEE